MNKGARADSDTALPSTLYVAILEETIVFRGRENPPPGFGTADASANLFKQEVAYLTGKKVMISHSWEDFPDGTVVGVYRLESTKATHRSVQLLDIGESEVRR